MNEDPIQSPRRLWEIVEPPYNQVYQFEVMAAFRTPLPDSIYPVQIARHLEFLPEEMWFVFSPDGMR